MAGAATAALPTARAASSPRQRRIVIVGGGIIGASIAYHTAKRGGRVTLIEKKRPAGGATENSFAWINSNSKYPAHYGRLNWLSVLEYRRLQQELGGELNIQWGGSLGWTGDAQAAHQLRRQVREHLSWGYPMQLVDEARFHALEPELQPGPVLAAVHATQEGSLDPVHATEVLLQRAAAFGARIEYPCEITGIDLRWGELQGLRTTCGDIATDTLVIAAGVDTPRLAAMVGLEVPLRDSPGVLAHTKPTSSLVGRVVLSPGGHWKQKLDGRLVVGTGFGRSPTTDTSSAQGQRILEDASSYVPRLAELPLERVTLGWRPLPSDNHPILGFATGAPDIYLAVMHSGVTLAPLVGRLVALEVLENIRVELLEPYRLSRFEA